MEKLTDDEIRVKCAEAMVYFGLVAHSLLGGTPVRRVGNPVKGESIRW